MLSPDIPRQHQLFERKFEKYNINHPVDHELKTYR